MYNNIKNNLMSAQDDLKPKQPIQTIENSVNLLYNTLCLPNNSTAQVILNSEQIIKFLESGVKIGQPLFDAYLASLLSIMSKYDGYAGYGYGGNRYGQQNDKQAMIKDKRVLNAIVGLLKNNEIEMDQKGEHFSAYIQKGVTLIFSAFILAGRRFNVVQTKEILQGIKSGYDECRQLIENNDAFDIDALVLETAAENNCEKFITRAIDKKAKLSQKCLYSAIANGNVALTKHILLTGPKLDEQSLVEACKAVNLELVKYILDNKIIPTNKCFNAVIGHKPKIAEKVGIIKAGVDSDSDSDYNYGHRHRNRTIKKVGSGTNSNIIGLLKTFGYKITYDDLTNATKKRITIDNFDSLGIKLDTDFLEVCVGLGFYPYKTDGIVPSAVCLEKECEKSGNLTNIKKIIAQGVAPTVKCLQNASKIRSNVQTIRYLLDKGVQPDLTCIKNITYCVGNSSSQIIVDKYIEHVESLAKKSVVGIKKINANAKIIATSSDNSDDSDANSDTESEQSKKNDFKSQSDESDVSDSESKRSSKSASDMSSSSVNFDKSDNSSSESSSDEEPIMVVKPVKKTVTKKAPVKKVIKQEISDSEEEAPKPVKRIVEKKTPEKKTPAKKISESKASESENEKPTKVKKTVTKKVVAKKVTKPVELTDSEDDVPAIPIKSVEKTDTFVNMPEDYDIRAERQIDTKILTLISLKSGQTYSFLTVRKHLLTYLIKQKAIIDSTVKINKTVGLLINKKENDIVQFSDFDKIVYNLIKDCKIPDTKVKSK